MRANGNVPIERSVLPGDALLATDTTVQRMMEVAEGEYGMRSPKIRALAINIVREAGVREKDYYGELVAIHKWVQKNIRYMKDPVNQETLSHPEETVFNSRAGDCDDMTILEIALLGSIGIQAWPVVIGVAPGIPSHVYLRAKVPPGRHRKAGKIVNLDPIMKEWRAGREAPASRVKIAHDYRDGNYMQGIQRHRTPADPGSTHMSDLGDAYNMLPGMGSYVQSESYLDMEHSHAEDLLKPDLAESTGSVANAPKVTSSMEGIDGMFGGGMGDVVDVGVPARSLGPLGPMTSLASRRSTHAMDSQGPKEISAKSYDVPTFNARLNNRRGKASTTVVDSRVHVVTEQNGASEAAKAPKSPTEERQELAGLMGILGEIQTSFMPGLGTMGEDDRLEVAERAATVGWWARLKARLAAARAGWYQERAAQARLHQSRLAEEHARRGLMAEKQNEERANHIAASADAVTHQMARMDPAMAEAAAEAEASLNASHNEAVQIDGLLGLSADDLQASGGTSMSQAAEVSARSGRRSRPAQTERARGSVTAREREQIHLRRHRQIAEDKMNRLQTAGRRSRPAVRRQRQRDRGPQLMTPIQATSMRVPEREGRRPLFRGAAAVQRLRPVPLPMAGLGATPSSTAWWLAAAAAAAGLYMIKRK